VSVLGRSRSASALALLTTALVSGAFAGLIAGCFIWLFDEGIQLVWVDLPERVGVDPFDSWWLFAILIGGGLLVGLCQRFIGNYPRPMEDAIATWRAGGHIEPIVAPKSAVNALVALVMGGPIGFEDALVGLLGGTATWIYARIGAVGDLVRQAWGAETIDDLPHVARHLPYWLAALTGLFTYKWLPFGAVDVGFRFENLDTRVEIADGLRLTAFAAIVVVPTAWAVSVVGRAERATVFRRAPILIATAAGLLFALLALGDDLILFSGQQGIQLLPLDDTGQLLYVAVFKWVALVVALLAGWRGGPIFPSYTSVAALGVIAADLVDVPPHLMMVAGIAAVSMVFCKSSIPLAFILTLYPTPLSYAGAILLGCVGAAVGLAVAGAFGALPETPGSEPVDRQG
jgi:hypothetical protein